MDEYLVSNLTNRSFSCTLIHSNISKYVSLEGKANSDRNNGWTSFLPKDVRGLFLYPFREKFKEPWAIENFHQNFLLFLNFVLTSQKLSIIIFMEYREIWALDMKKDILTINKIAKHRLVILFLVRTLVTQFLILYSFR